MLDGMLNLQPWLPPAAPDLVMLAMAAADEAGVQRLQAWPEWRKGGIGFGALPPFLAWQGEEEGRWHLVLLQPREVGALVPGARRAALPEGWLAALDLEALARPLACHPDFPGGASVHVVHLPGGSICQVRTRGIPQPEVVLEVLKRLTDAQNWSLLTSRDCSSGCG